MSLNPYGYRHMPQIVKNLYGKASERSTINITVEDSTTLALGQFVALNDATNGKEFGITTLADDDFVFGFVSGFARQGSSLPIWEDGDRAGTVTDPTGEIPLKYAFSATNDGGNTTSADLEQAIITPIQKGDVLEVALWGGAAVSVARGTTTAEGTTGSSANMGVSMSLATSYPWALLESTAAVAQANLDAMTIHLDGKQPSDPNHVYVIFTRSFDSAAAAN